MRRTILILIAAISLPQATGAQQAIPATVPPWTPFAVNGPAAPDSAGAGTQSLPTAQERVDASAAAAVRNSTVIGAGAGFVLGAATTWVVLHTGGSTAPCDRDANQDAMNTGECVGITVLGGAVGALLGALIARLL